MAENLKECSVSCKSSWRQLAELCRLRRLRCPALGVSRRTLRRHFEVEQLLDYRRVKDEDFYLVKWEGYPESSNTWEPKKNLRCPGLLRQLHLDLSRAPGGPFRPGPRGLPPRAASYLRQKAEQRRELQRWERLLNSSSGGGGGGLRIVVENEVDLQGPPRDFVYGEDYKLGPGVEVTPVAAGCECSDCYREGCAGRCCPGASRIPFPYTAGGRLRLRAGLPIFECNSRCRCGRDCPNRVVQRRGEAAGGGAAGRGERRCLCIFRTADGRGWGVRTLHSIRSHRFVMEYVGEIITTEEAERRGQEYDRQGATYLFDLDYVEDVYTVDAARYGNISHFVNHSCEPNLQVFNVFIENLDPRLPRIALFSARHIRAGEELTFDYRMRVDPVDAESSQMDSNFGFGIWGHQGGSPRARGRMECKCGAGTCRKFLC
ncbi:LOW QUALITY PROTEIN: histone-lysine N-methyltransferase SUV39H1 [Melanerpes formicivorus]|uniref:LOW QUALITY PROTEIN: histone-lysine N-methyltransferase SUV39H1 n=1 Tax=Melanerpes formicivorus TaxID=211600 RepID=UPI00358F4CC5